MFIYIEALKTLITGDLIFNGKVPYMGDAYIDDWTKALNYMGDLDAEIYIPGHGDPGGKPILIAMKHYLFELRQRVLRQIEKGSSLKETQNIVGPMLKKNIEAGKIWSGSIGTLNVLIKLSSEKLRSFNMKLNYKMSKRGKVFVFGKIMN